jgi:glucose-6-phosphate isomerase
MAENKKWDIILHPEVGGRFSGLTSCGLVPAYLMRLNIKKILAGAEAGYKNYSARVSFEKNDALKLALAFYELGNRGYAEIFASFYSSSLVALFPLLTQLIHETYGKNGRGQTFFGDYSPESQHHTNQRFFGGPENVIGLFLSEEKMERDLRLSIPASLKKIIFHGYELGKLNGLKASETLQLDKIGVIQNCQHKNIPAVEVIMDKLTESSFGEMIVFWQYFSIYSALLRGLNPFDQPEVEAAKKISLALRMKK